LARRTFIRPGPTGIMMEASSDVEDFVLNEQDGTARQKRVNK
jgi:hypothetical protein